MVCSVALRRTAAISVRVSARASTITSISTSRPTCSAIHSTFLVEHHFTGWSQVSATLSLLTYLAARTKTLRLRTAVMVLPWHKLVLLAGAGRDPRRARAAASFLLARRYRHSEFTGFCIPSEEAEERFEEGLEVILKAWTSEGRFSHHGKFWNFENIVVGAPLAAQRPRPTIWMGAGSEPSIRKVATRGFNLLLDQFAGADLIKQRIDFFQSELKAVGRSYNPMEVCVARELYVAKDQKDKEDAIERLNATRQRTIDVSKAPNQCGGSHILAYAKSGAPDVSSTLIGTTDEIHDKLVALNEAGAEYVILSVLGGSRHSLRQFANEIIPEFNSDRAVGRGAGRRSCNEGRVLMTVLRQEYRDGIWREPAPLCGVARLDCYPWLIVGNVCIGAFMGQLDASIAQLVLPEVEQDFHVSIGAAAWVSIAYLLVAAAMLPVFGRLADMVGRKLLYCGGFVVFVTGSALCGLAPSLDTLVAARVLQALGAGLLQANAIAIIVAATAKARRGRAPGYTRRVGQV